MALGVARTLVKNANSDRQASARLPRVQNKQPVGPTRVDTADKLRSESGGDVHEAARINRDGWHNNGNVSFCVCPADASSRWCCRAPTADDRRHLLPARVSEQSPFSSPNLSSV
jgi:hypothetical protein